MSKQFTDVKGNQRRHTVCLDLDGTLVENRWPELGAWMPGAKEAILTFHKAGIKLVVFSARLNPYDPWTSQPRDKAEVAIAKQGVRRLLDDAGFHFVDIWSSPGKPGASVYIDDRAERYHGRPGSWKALTQKVMLRLGMEDPETPVTIEDPLLDYTRHCSCPAGSYNPGNVHEPYCMMTKGG